MLSDVSSFSRLLAGGLAASTVSVPVGDCYEKQSGLTLSGQEPPSIRFEGTQETTEFPVSVDAVFPTQLDIGRVPLKMAACPQVVMRVSRNPIVCLKGWNIEIPFGDTIVETLTREMARKFLMLSSKLAEEFTEGERETWHHIVENVDYDKYCYDVSEPEPYVGRVEKIKDGVVTVKFVFDNERRKISGDMVRASRLNLCNQGESFSCRAKLSRDGRAVVNLTDVTPLTDVEPDVVFENV